MTYYTNTETFTNGSRASGTDVDTDLESVETAFASVETDMAKRITLDDSGTANHAITGNATARKNSFVVLNNSGDAAKVTGSAGQAAGWSSAGVPAAISLTALSSFSPTISAGDARKQVTVDATETTYENHAHDAMEYYADAGVNDTYQVTLSPAPSAYYSGMRVTMLANTVNTGPCTLDVNALGVKNIKLIDGTDPYNGAILDDGIAIFQYDGTNFQLLNPAVRRLGAATTTIGTATIASTATTIATLAVGAVKVGQIVMINAGCTATKGATAGLTTLYFGESGATTALVDGSTSGTNDHKQALEVAISAAPHLSISAVRQVVTAGTLSITFIGISAGSDSTATNLSFSALVI